MNDARCAAVRLFTSPLMDGVEGEDGLFSNRRLSDTEPIAIFPFPVEPVPPTDGMGSGTVRRPVTQPAIREARSVTNATMAKGFT